MCTYAQRQLQVQKGIINWDLICRFVTDGMQELFVYIHCTVYKKSSWEFSDFDIIDYALWLIGLIGADPPDLQKPKKFPGSVGLKQIFH